MLITPSLSFASCCVDFDGDGYNDPKTCRSGTDCDDGNALIHPGTLGCNSCKDSDDDGYFAHDLLDCSLGTDCDDANPEVNPGKGNCGGNGGGNGGGGCSNEWYPDIDNDGYSNGTTVIQCDRPYGYKLASELIQTFGDCDDNDNTMNPGKEDVCDDWEKDNNCDGTIDEGCCEGWVTVDPNEVYPQRAEVAQWRMCL